MKTKLLAASGIALAACACAVDATDSGAETEPSAGNGAEFAESIAEPVQAENEQQLSELQQAAEAANRTQLILGPSAQLVAELPSGEAGKIYFVEGDIGVSIFEIQRVGERSALSDLSQSGTALEAYQSLTGNQDAPEALVRAQQRVDQLHLDVGTGAAETAPAAEELAQAAQTDLQEAETHGEIGVVSQAAIDDSACPGSAFEDQLCDFWRTGQGICDLWKTGTGYYKRSDVHWTDTHACPYRGTVTHRLRYKPWGTWYTSGKETLAPGWYSTISHSDSWDFDIESRVYDADGDGWHMSVTWRD